MKYFIFFSLIYFATNLSAQVRKCGTDMYEKLSHTDSDYLIIKEQLILDRLEFINSGKFQQVYNYYNSSANQRRSSSGEVIVIPIVFHIIGDEANSFVSSNMINSQLQALNNDYRRIAGTLGYGTGADTQIEFCLASVDPDGNPTSGVNKIYGSHAPYNGEVDINDDIELKSLISWSFEDYLNVWVTNLVTNSLAYSSYPGQFTNISEQYKDGIVINYENFGINQANVRYGLGRTLTHEVGHWLGLLHPWGEDVYCICCSDNIDDTPVCSDEYYSQISFNCQTEAQCTNENNLAGLTDIRMVGNYMEYSDDPCFSLFTAGQKQAMLTTIFTQRSSLFNSIGGCKNETDPCKNGAHDPGETGIDCGGSCPPCAYPTSYYVGCSYSESYNPSTSCVPKNNWINIYGCLNGATNGPSRVMYSNNYNIGTRAFHFTSGKVSIYADCNEDNQPNTSGNAIKSGVINLKDGFKFISTPQNEIRFIIQDLPEWTLQINRYYCAKSTREACPPNQVYRTRPSMKNEDVTENETASPEIIFFPNPVSDILSVKLNEILITQWELYDKTNRLLVSGDVNSDFSVDFYSYSSGIYFLRLFNSEESFVKKIIYIGSN